jgi:hypothetical protein
VVSTIKTGMKVNGKINSNLSVYVGISKISMLIIRLGTGAAS